MMARAYPIKDRGENGAAACLTMTNPERLSLDLRGERRAEPCLIQLQPKS
jgi:hypothetical protein